MVTLLAFLACARATVDQSGRVTLHELFDGLVIPRGGAFLGPRFPGPRRPHEQVFFVFYKVIVDMPCTVILRVFRQSGEEVPGEWRDPISPATAEPSTWQSLWALSVMQFQQPGWYTLELSYSHGGEPTRLAWTLLLVQTAE
jgi:hypothetical protein